LPVGGRDRARAGSFDSLAPGLISLWRHAMKRTPLRRKTPLRKRRNRPRRGQVISPETMREIREQANHRCEYCGRWCEHLEVHHIAERGMGGGRRRDERWNLVALCPDCHRGYHEGRIPRREFISGWLDTGGPAGAIQRVGGQV